MGGTRRPSRVSEPERSTLNLEAAFTPAPSPPHGARKSRDNRRAGKGLRKPESPSPGPFLALCEGRDDLSPPAEGPPPGWGGMEWQ